MVKRIMVNMVVMGKKTKPFWSNSYPPLKGLLYISANIFSLIIETVTKALNWTIELPLQFSGSLFFSNSLFPVPPSQVWLGHPGDSFLSPPPSLMRTGSSFSISTFYRNLGNWPLLLLQPLCLTLEPIEELFLSYQGKADQATILTLSY